MGEVLHPRLRGWKRRLILRVCFHVGLQLFGLPLRRRGDDRRTTRWRRNLHRRIGIGAERPRRRRRARSGAWGNGGRRGSRRRGRRRLLLAWATQRGRKAPRAWDHGCLRPTRTRPAPAGADLLASPRHARNGDDRNGRRLPCLRRSRGHPVRVARDLPLLIERLNRWRRLSWLRPRCDAAGSDPRAAWAIRGRGDILNGNPSTGPRIRHLWRPVAPRGQSVERVCLRQIVLVCLLTAFLGR